MTTDTIKSIQRQIVTKLETGEDISELTEQLTRETARIETQKKIEQLKKIADERQALKEKAAEIREKVKLQGEAIDRFLELRDTIVSQLEPLLEPVRKLAEMQSMNRDGPGECYAGFNDIAQFGGAVRLILQGYLPPDFGCPFVEMIGGQDKANDKASEAYTYFSAAVGILSNFTKGISTLPLRPAAGFMAIDTEPETTEVELNCRVCKNPKAAEINKALEAGRPLREIETEFNVSRSSLSRHKNNCLNLGVVRMRD